MLNIPIQDTWTLDPPSDPADMKITLHFDPEVLVGTIITKAETLEPICLDPVVFKYKTDNWWKKWKHTFQRWWEQEAYEYMPLWDRDGYEDIKEDTAEVGTLDSTTHNTEVIDDDSTFNEGGSSTTTSSSNSSSTTTNNVSAYDANDYQPHDQSTTNANASGTDTNTYSKTGSSTDDRTTDNDGTIDTDTTNNKDFTHKLHSWGNWGISVTVQKLKEQEIRVSYVNLYEMAADIFCRELLVRVYL